MLVIAPMRSLLALGLLVGTASVANAGTYVGLGIGTGPGTSGDMAMVEDGRSGRLELGFSFGRLAVEGIANKFDLMSAGDDNAPYSALSLGAAGKLNVPLADHFEVFGRLGYQKSFLSADAVNRPDYEGSGLFGGAGFEYKLSFAVTSMSLFVDYTVSRSALTAPMNYGDREFGFTTRLWTLGATLSI